MKNVMYLILGLTISLMAQAESERTLSVPAGNLLAAARKIVPQTSSGYFVKGILECSQVSQSIPPYSVESKCTVDLNNQVNRVDSPEELIQALKEAKPMTGPTYFFKAEFSAKSVGKLVAPFEVSESAQVLLGISVPATKILAATRKIVTQTGPAYFIEGTLECSLFSKNVPPYEVSYACAVEIDDSRQSISDPEELILALMRGKPMTGPAYLIRAKFSASSVSQHAPPYLASEKAEAILFQ